MASNSEQVADGWRWTRCALSVSVVLGAWELVSRTEVVSPTLFPPPTAVASAFWEWLASGVLIQDLNQSLWRAWVGLGAGVVLGLGVGVCTGRLAPFRDFVAPILMMVRPLPPVAIIPLMIVWFGIDSIAKVTAIALAVFFPVWISAHVAAQTIPRSYVWAARSLQLGRARTIVRVVLPASMAVAFPGVRTGVAVAFVMLYVTELSGASSGLGYRISVSHLAYRIDTMMAALAALAATAAITDILIAALGRRLMPWVGKTR